LSTLTMVDSPWKGGFNVKVRDMKASIPKEVIHLAERSWLSSGAPMG